MSACTSYDQVAAGWRGSLRDAVSLLLITAFGRLATWQDRASQRHRLAGLDDRMLSDMGVSRGTIEQEIRKPFWTD